MTPEQVKERIQAIRNCGGDFEKAHSLEDRLLWDFVQFMHDSMLDNFLPEITQPLLDWQKESEDASRWYA